MSSLISWEMTGGKFPSKRYVVKWNFAMVGKHVLPKSEIFRLINFSAPVGAIGIKTVFVQTRNGYFMVTGRTSVPFAIFIKVIPSFVLPTFRASTAHFMFITAVSTVHTDKEFFSITPVTRYFVKPAVDDFVATGTVRQLDRSFYILTDRI